MTDLLFWKNKRVFITGHTGFKGAWLCSILTEAGTDVTGYSLPPPAEPNLFTLTALDRKIKSITGDIRDKAALQKAFDDAQPDIVIHMAAQPLVLDGYQDPHYTYETNIMGTVNILECLRSSKSVRSFLNVTTDKVYFNNEWEWGYRENEPLDGADPYSNSKSCSELVTHSYKSSFFSDGRIAISTARAGNVIGGGDFSANRIIPDCVRAASAKKNIILRMQNSIRPYQHVLEPLFVYMIICQKQMENNVLSGYYNVGPDECDCISTGELAEIFCKTWGEDMRWESSPTTGPHEANFLRLDCSRLKSIFGWKPRWGIVDAVKHTVAWYKEYLHGGDIVGSMSSTITEYINTRRRSIHDV